LGCVFGVLVNVDCDHCHAPLVLASQFIQDRRYHTA
jgi:hypothetical protein